MKIEQNALKERLFDGEAARNIKFFRGSDSNVSPEEMAREVNKFFADVENGADEHNPNGDVEG